MSEEANLLAREVPTYSECVVGYRAWGVDSQGQLWPLADRRNAWQPGVNTARCNCLTRPGVNDVLKFEWIWRDGKRVLEPAPPHVAPATDCECGLYSWRQPRRIWGSDPRYRAGTRVCGAVASWGRMQVHHDGFRAEHACVVALAYPPDTESAAFATLRRVADAYRVELVPLAELEEAARHRGAPLPANVGPEEHVASELSRPPGRQPDRDPSSSNVVPAPDITLEEFERKERAQRLRRSRTPIIVGVLVILAAIAALLVFDPRTRPCHLQVISIVGSRTIERCAPHGQHGGFFPSWP